MLKRLLATMRGSARSSSKAAGKTVSRTGTTPKPIVRPAADFRAVSLVPRIPICWAAEQQIGKRILLRKNPRLPLPDCSMPHDCTCKFAMHADRRQSERRANTVHGGRLATGSAERRQTRGRRSTDR
jgi:hypothetical protein